MSNLIENTIAEIVTKELRENEINKAMIITYKYSFMEFFEKEITDEHVNVLNELYDLLHIDNQSINMSGTIHYLFINKGGYYMCYYSVDNSYQTELTNEWNYTTNHDTCWRTNAFVNKEILYKIIKDIFEISKNIKLSDDPRCPKHIAPNFGNITITKNLEIDTSKASSEVKTYHKLVRKNSSSFDIIENVEDILITTDNAKLILDKDEYHKYKQLETIGKTRGPNKCIRYNPSNKTFN